MSKSIITNPNEIQHYIKDIRKIPVISHERQDQIFSLLKKQTITKEEKNSLYKELIMGNLRFVISIAKSYKNHNDFTAGVNNDNIDILNITKVIDDVNDGNTNPIDAVMTMMRLISNTNRTKIKLFRKMVMMNTILL